MEIPAGYFGCSVPAHVVDADTTSGRLAICEALEDWWLDGRTREIEFIGSVSDEAFAQEFGFHEKVTLGSVLRNVTILTPAHEGIAVRQELKVAAFLGSAVVWSIAMSTGVATLGGNTELIPGPSRLDSSFPRLG